VYEHTESIAIAREWVKERPYAATVFGTAMLVPIKLIREIGMFDESLFMYYEDLDLSVRSGRAGYRNLVDWSSVVYHDNKKKHRNPQEMKPHYWYYNARNSLRFWRRYLGLRRGLRIMWWEFNTYIRYWNLCRSNRTTGNAILAGLWHGCLDRGGAYDPEYVAPSLFIGVARRISRRKILQVSQSAI
jgi:GT2 family glycosyltransferase